MVKVLSKILPPAMPVGEAVTRILSSATQNWSQKKTKFTDNAASVRLWFSRVHFAQWLMDQQYPDAGWSFMTLEAFNHDLIMSGNSPPCLIEGVIEMDNTSEETGDLIAFGATGMQRSAASRRWMTDVEYRWISQFTRIHVTSFHQAKQYGPIPEQCRLPALFDDDQFFSHPVSSGVLAHLHCMALGTAKWSRTTSSSEHDVISTWMRAYDRSKCFQAAMIFEAHEFDVSGYGNGSVMVRAERSRVKELGALGLKIGMTQPNYLGLIQEFGYATPDKIY